MKRNGFTPSSLLFLRSFTLVINGFVSRTHDNYVKRYNTQRLHGYTHLVTGHGDHVGGCDRQQQEVKGRDFEHAPHLEINPINVCQ